MFQSNLRLLDIFYDCPVSCTLDRTPATSSEMGHCRKDDCQPTLWSLPRYCVRLFYIARCIVTLNPYILFVHYQPQPILDVWICCQMVSPILTLSALKLLMIFVAQWLTFNDICCPVGFFLYICCPVAYICFPVVAPMAVALEQMFGLTTATSQATTRNGSSTNCVFKILSTNIENIYCN